MKRRWTANRLRAEGLYFLRALRVLLGPASGLVIVWLIGAMVQHRWGGFAGEPPPNWTEALFTSYCLLLLEHIDHVPPHPIAQVVHYLQPLAGIVLFSEGVIKLGYTVFRKQDNARSWIEIMARASRGHVILCGLGNVGFRVLENLREMGLDVFAVERDEHAPFLDRARELGAEVIVGDARANELLTALNLDDARAVIVATDDDLANLEIAMDVREIRSDIPIVMRMFDQRLAQKVKATLGVSVSVSTSKVAAPLLAAVALDPGVVGTHSVGDTHMVVLDVGVRDGGQLSTSPGELATKHDLSVIAVQPRGASTWTRHPSPSDRIGVGDRLQVLVESERVSAVHELNGPG